MGIFRCRWTREALIGLVVLPVLLAACGGKEATPTPAATAQPTPTVAPSATPRPTETPLPPTATVPVSTPTPSPTPSPTPAPTLPPQAAELKLEVTSPAGDAVVTSDTVTVAGLTSPDATVSVNGVLVTPDSQGRFSVELSMSADENPLSIEVIATSVAGEQQSVVRTVIFIP